MVSLEVARVAVLALMVGVVGIAWLPNFGVANDCQCLTVTFLDVGQGDAVYIRTPDNYELLIDGGKDSRVLQQLVSQQSWFDRQLDVVVATHPDADHIGGLIPVLERYHVGAILMTETEKSTPEATRFLEAVDVESASVIYADAGQRFLLGASTSITVFSPTGDESKWEPNNASVILKISYGETDVLLTGDASTGVEEYLVETYGELLSADILKLGHHGSNTSTSELFLDTVRPQYAIVSAAVDNRYNHPHQAVIERVFERNIQTFHTGIDGNITFQSDGNRLWFK